MAKPVPFGSHVDGLMHGFRTSLPQVGALLQFMPDELLGALIRELQLLLDRAMAEMAKRSASPHA